MSPAADGPGAAADERPAESTSPTSPLDPVLPGQSSSGRLADYDVLKAVGKGGYSVVYKGTRRKDQRVVAIKRIEIFDMAPKKRERCLSEVQLLQTCKHPNIIQMLDAFIDDNQLIIVFEWAPAGDLKRLIKKTAEGEKQLEESLIWNYFFQIADAVWYMHKNRIMHRDIKPANVLVGANGALKLGDLGLGRHFSENTNEVFSKVGTPYYVSPEVVKGVGYDWKSDVWSLGCLLYELAVLKSPFETEGANLYEVFQKINAGDYTPLPQDRHSKVLRNLVARMLQTEPSQRPEMEEVWQVTRSVFDHQHQVSRSTHLTSELAVDKLVLLGTEINRQVAARQLVGGSAGPATLVPMPRHQLAAIHPLFFAEGDAPAGGKSGGGRKAKGAAGAALEGSSSQFHVMVGIVLWLFQLNGRAQDAAEIEKELSLMGDVRSDQPPPAGYSVDDASRLRVAERLRSVTKSLGQDVDFATAQGIAAGCGRTVCMLLDALAESTILSTGVKARKPLRGDDDGAAAREDFEEILEDLELPESDVVGEAGLPGHDDDEHSDQRSRGGGPRGGASLRSAEGLRRVMIEPTVDPRAWLEEAERLGPQLKRIEMKAGGSGRFGGWQERFRKAVDAGRDLRLASPDVQRDALAWVAEVGQQLEALARRESYLNREWGALTAQYSEAKARLASVIKRRDQAEEQVGGATSSLAEMTSRLHALSEAIEERQADFDGARPLTRMRDAIASLHEEIRAMGTASGLAHSQLLAQQTKAAAWRLAS